jgi:hypothetical protein
VELALDYAGPCAHIYADLADLCVELEHLRWGAEPVSPRRRPDGKSEEPSEFEGSLDDAAAKDKIAFQPMCQDDDMPRPQRSLDWWSDEPASPSLIPPDADGARLVGNFGASRKDEAACYLIDNSGLNAKSAGLGYRRTPNMDDKDGRSFAKWGSIVYGTPVGSDWVKVEGRYLPRHVGGVSVVVPQARNSPTKNGPTMM